MITTDALSDSAFAEDIISNFLADPTDRLIALKQLVDSANYAASVAPSAWGVTLYSNIFRLNVGMVEVLVVGNGFIRLNCVGQAGEEPFIGSNFENTEYRSVPNPQCRFLGTPNEFAEIESHLQTYHKKFIDIVGLKKNGEPFTGSNAIKSHFAGLMDYAHTFVASQVPDEKHWIAKDELSSSEPFFEGGRLTILVNAFERNTTARKRCLEHYGATCVVCGFNAQQKYGDHITEVIHVHHLKPLSSIGQGYIIDPISDLRPVCPNCHAVIHSRDPIFSIDELAALFQKEKSCIEQLKSITPLLNESWESRSLKNMKREDEPYALKVLSEQQRRRSMLHQSHIEPLATHLAKIKAEHPEKELPCFDPCDGGVRAKVLFLLEAPGPKAVGSTFISRNNPDPIARNICELLQEAGIARGDTLLWNIVPWYVGDGSRIRAVTDGDICQSFPYFKDLLSLLPNLEVIALLGKKAQSAKGQIRQLTSLPIIEMPHPSATNFNTRPHNKDEMRERLRQIAAIINRN